MSDDEVSAEESEADVRAPSDRGTVTNTIIAPKCSGCGTAITARQESANAGRCDVCLQLDRESAVHLAKAPERPWWLSGWWLGAEGAASVLAFLIGAVMLEIARPSPSLLPDWWLAVAASLMVLGPANIALSVALWLTQHDSDTSAERASLVRCLVLLKIVISALLFPLLIFLLLAALYARRSEEEVAERTIDLLGGALIGAVADRPRQRTGICALCGRDTYEGKQLCDRCAALGKRRPARRLLYGGLAVVDSADAEARNAHLFVRRKPGWLNSFGGWHVILDEHDVGTLTRSQERRFEVAPGSHAVKVKVAFLTTNTIEFTSDESEIFLECGLDKADVQAYRLARVDVLSHRLDTLRPTHQRMT